MNILRSLILLAAGFTFTGCGSQTGEKAGAAAGPVEAAIAPVALQEAAPAAKYQDWHLPFTDKALTEEAVKLEIEQVIESFRRADENYTLNLKKLDDPDRKGFIARAWFRAEQPVANEWTDTDFGANGSVKVYFDHRESLRLVEINSHSSSWTRSTYHYFDGQGRQWTFFFGGELEYDENGMGSIRGASEKLSENLGPNPEEGEDTVTPRKVDEFFPEYHDRAKKLQEIAFNFFDDRSGVYNYRGQLNWKYDFAMHLDTDELGQVTGKYRYKSSKSDLKLSGSLENEILKLTETDPNGKETGRWLLRWTELDKIEGKWFKLTETEHKFVEMKPVADYGFE